MRPPTVSWQPPTSMYAASPVTYYSCWLAGLLNMHPTYKVAKCTLNASHYILHTIIITALPTGRTLCSSGAVIERTPDVVMLSLGSVCVV